MSRGAPCPHRCTIRAPCLASDAGCRLQYCHGQGLHQAGSYTAELASHSHQEAYRSSDVQGRHQDDEGKYFHLLLFNVLRGKPLESASDAWAGHEMRCVEEKLGTEFDSIELQCGRQEPAAQDQGEGEQGCELSAIYVAYHASQCLPEFIVTYTEVEGAEEEGNGA